MGPNGWPFANVDFFPEAGVDSLNNADHVKDLYLKDNPEYGGRSVPVQTHIVALLTLVQFKVHGSRTLGQEAECHRE